MESSWGSMCNGSRRLKSFHTGKSNSVKYIQIKQYNYVILHIVYCTNNQININNNHVNNVIDDVRFVQLAAYRRKFVIT